MHGRAVTVGQMVVEEIKQLPGGKVNCEGPVDRLWTDFDMYSREYSACSLYFQVLSWGLSTRLYVLLDLSIWAVVTG